LVTLKGTEKAGGYTVKTVVLRTGTLTANTSLPLPAWAQGAAKILQAVKSHNEDAAAASTAAADLTVVTATPAAGQIQLYDPNNVRFGDAMTTFDLVFVALEYPSFQREI